MTLFKKAFAAHQEGNTKLAKELYAQVLKKEPNHGIALHNYWLIISEEDQLNCKEALAMMERSLVLQPKVAAFHHNIARVYSRTGQIEKAISHYKEAIRLKPDYAEAYYGLVDCFSCKGETELLQKIEALLLNKSLTTEQQCNLHFAAGKICADSARYDEAFSHYSQGNSLKNVTFNMPEYQLSVEQIIQFFNHDFIEKTKEWGAYSHTPIFILGMPRSGSTLTEQILSSHSMIYGVGEIGDIISIIKGLEQKLNEFYPWCLQNASHVTILTFAAQYLEQLKKLSSDKPRVINKSPINFKHIGLIFLMFPNAKIIHTVRHPIDTCLSCYFQNFSDHQAYAFDLENLAEFYNEYDKVMSHWNNVFPGKIFNLHYEDMINEQEKITRELLAYCDLPWEDNCLNFQENKRDVTTASKYQVRQSLYKSSVNRWKPYEKHLQPLISRLKGNYTDVDSFEQTIKDLIDISKKDIFFIVGVPKSGTTWLQNLLNGHPHISCKGESHLANALTRAVLDLLSKHNQLIARKNKMLNQENNGYPIFEQQQQLYIAKTLIYLLFKAQIGDKQGVTMIGEKTPDNIRIMPDIVDHLIPQAKFIHIIRDGRDGAVSGWHHIYRNSPEWAKEEYPTFQKYADSYAKVWQTQIAQAQQFGINYPGHYLEVRYELLHSQPNEQIKRILSFLNADISDEIIAGCQTAAKFEKLSQGRNRGEENTSSHYRKGVVGDWQSLFDENSIQGFKMHAGKLLEDLGYHW
jgi:tetratricopeptide (TPR) repeat protein